MTDPDLSKERRKQLDSFIDVPAVQNNMRLDFYYGMSRQILTQAQRFSKEGDQDRAYIFYKRFLLLGLDCIPDHVAYRDSKFNQDKNWLIGERRHAFEALESVKTAMNDELREAEDRRQATAKQPQQQQVSAVPQSSTTHDDLDRRFQALRGDDAAFSSTKNLLDKGTDEGTDLANLHDELMSSDSDGGEGRGGEGAISSAPPLDDDSYLPTAPPGPWSGFDDQRNGNRQQGEGEEAPEEPSIDFETAFNALRMEPEEGQGRGTRYYPVFKGRPVPPPPILSPPKIKRDESSGTFWDRRPKTLKPVALPTGLIGKFLEVAEPNTRKRPDGIETCGILAGKIKEDDDVVRCTTLIIPKQQGTSDTVAMSHEEELWAYCHSDDRDLSVLGWIHTHPCQSCFMSSVDVHTHCPYQLMLAEAVAIVVAPKDPRKQVGVFRLTEPHGLQLIQRCKLTGFHPHPSDFEIYKDHHAIRWENASFVVVDLRK